MSNKYATSLAALAVILTCGGYSFAQTSTLEQDQQSIEPAQQAQQPAAEEQRSTQPGQQDKQATEPAQQQQQAQQPEVQVQRDAGKPTEDPKPQFTVETILNDDRSAAELADADLRTRIEAAKQFAADESVSRAHKNAMLDKAKTDTAELNGRIAAATGVAVRPGLAEQEAVKLLLDKRAAAELDDGALRERMKMTRGLLAAEGISDRTAKVLRANLKVDSDEIRERVAKRVQSQEVAQAGEATEQGKSNDLPQANPNQMTVNDLKQDSRPAADLTSSALQRRIDANRRALSIKELPEADRLLFEARLEADRADLRMRLAERKRGRKKELSAGAAIAIGAGVGLVAGVIIAARPTITVAEAYDEELQDWLISPPLIKVKPRYRVQDFAEQPRLRYAVPGIEVDTIRFGFGEAFLRAEEVSKLDRIARLIERIVASNPDEVFLIEGHTDAVGTREANQVLSLERAKAVRQALLDYYNIDEENLAVVGQGERYLKIPTELAEAENRRVTLRRITSLLARNQ